VRTLVAQSDLNGEPAGNLLASVGREVHLTIGLVTLLAGSERANLRVNQDLESRACSRDDRHRPISGVPTGNQRVPDRAGSLAVRGCHMLKEMRPNALIGEPAGKSGQVRSH
jgi:hypothetical protein